MSAPFEVLGVIGITILAVLTAALLHAVFGREIIAWLCAPYTLIPPLAVPFLGLMFWWLLRRA